EEADHDHDGNRQNKKSYKDRSERCHLQIRTETRTHSPNFPPCGSPASMAGGLRSGGDKHRSFSPHIAVLVHHRVPARHAAHARPEGATVPHRTGTLNFVAGRADNVTLRWLALHPIAPLVCGHMRLGGVQHSGIIALAIEKGADPAREI